MEDGFYEHLKKQGLLKDESLPPDVTHHAYIIESFFELQTDVNFNGVIPWTTIHQFATINKIEDFDLFLHCIRVLESAFKEESNGTTD